MRAAFLVAKAKLKALLPLTFRRALKAAAITTTTTPTTTKGHLGSSGLQSAPFSFIAYWKLLECGLTGRSVMTSEPSKNEASSSAEMLLLSELAQNFKSKWLEATLSSSDTNSGSRTDLTVNNNRTRHINRSEENRNKRAKNVEEISFHRIRMNKLLIQDLEEHLKEEFYASTLNIYDLHLDLLGFCFEQMPHKKESALFVNQTFSNWHSNMRNRAQKKGSKSPADEMVSKAPTEQQVVRAFDMAASNHMALLAQLNKIYSFSKHYELLEKKIYDAIKTLQFVDQAELIGTLEIQHKFNLENLVIPLMLQNKYAAIDSFANKNEQITLSIVDLCNRLCNNYEVSLKDVEK